MRTHANLSCTDWRKSRRSSAGADCVEVAVIEIPAVPPAGQMIGSVM
jgi:Domain of unknown function (DUF397)